MLDGKPSSTRVRSGLAVLALCVSVTALNAAELAPVPVQTETAVQDGPQFEPSFEDAFDDMGDPAALAVPDHAVDLAEIETGDEDAAGDPIDGGVASWYGRELAGRPTANGERFDPSELTAAHRTLPFGTKVRVTHAQSGRSVVVRINDRGPFHGGRVIDLSQAAAEAIGLRSAGSGRVTLARLAS